MWKLAFDIAFWVLVIAALGGGVKGFFGAALALFVAALVIFTIGRWVCRRFSAPQRSH